MHRFECNIKPWGDVPTLTPCSGLDGHWAPLCSRAFIGLWRAITGPYGHLAALAMMVVKLNGDASASEAGGAARLWSYLSDAPRSSPSAHPRCRLFTRAGTNANQFQRMKMKLTLAVVHVA